MTIRSVAARFWISAVLVLTVGATSRMHSQTASTTAAAHPHSAQLTWKAPSNSSGPPVQKYKIYRAPAKKKHNGVVVCGKFEQIATIDAPSTTYKDVHVGAGQVYCYYVRATTTAGDSEPSPPITAVIPKP